jgi:hypothetical protein
VLSPEQYTHLDNRDPDVRLCPHQVEVTEMGTPDGPIFYLMRIKGHMVLEDDVDDRGTVEDHRLFCVEIPMNPTTWQLFVDTLNDTDGTINRVAKGYKRQRKGDHVAPEDIARFMNSIPEIFLKDPRKDDQ